MSGVIIGVLGRYFIHDLGRIPWKRRGGTDFTSADEMDSRYLFESDRNGRVVFVRNISGSKRKYSSTIHLEYAGLTFAPSVAHCC